MILEAELEHVDPTTAVFRLTGRMTLGMRLREIETKISSVADNNVQRLALDLSGVEYADSAGLGLLMILYGKMKTSGGQLRLIAPSPRVLEMLKMTCTDAILTIAPDRDTALAI
jgi:anti-sigma B factor antagonist